MFNKNIILFYLLFLSFIFSNKDFFYLQSKTDNNFFIDFKIDNYSIEKIDNKTTIFLDNDSLLISDNLFFSTLIQIDLNQEYNINLNQESITSYNFEDTIYKTNISSSYYNIKEHILFPFC